MVECSVENFPISRDDFVASDLYKLFPAINVDRVKDIPCDYPGVMGVPITFLDKFDKEQFEILGMLRPVIDGKDIYNRILIRNIKPELPEVFNLSGLYELYGSKYRLIEIVERMEDS